MQNAIPEEGFLRLSQIIGRPATAYSPAIPALIPVSRARWYEGVAEGRFPRPIRLSPRCSMYRVEDIRALIASIGAKASA